MEKYNNDDDLEYPTQQVQAWTRAIPIGLGLCPWAMKAQRQNLLYYRTCTATTPSEVASLIRSEAETLCGTDNNNSSSMIEPWSTTLIVCPNVAAWNDFEVFDDFVQSQTRELAQQQQQQQQEEIPVTLVPFHPNFLKWRGLPRGVHIGSVVQSYKGFAGGFQKSPHRFPATVLETNNPVFGLRKIKVRFHSHVDDNGGDPCRKEQYVPMDWLVLTDDNDGDLDNYLGDSLPDNAMHRAPYPTVHLIRNEDLGRLRARDVSRVKRKNAQTMMNLGWEGVQRQLATRMTNGKAGSD